MQASQNHVNRSSAKPHSTGFLRLNQIIGCKRQGIEPILPIGRSTFLEKVRRKEWPQPVKLTARTVAWRASDIADLVEQLGGLFMKTNIVNPQGQFRFKLHAIRTDLMCEFQGSPQQRIFQTGMDELIRHIDSEDEVKRERLSGLISKPLEAILDFIEAEQAARNDDAF